MSVRRGIGILDLLPFTTGLAGAIPDTIVEQIGVLTVLDHRATTSTDFFLHEGTLQSAADALDVNTQNWVVRIPGLTHGLPFRLAVQRVTAAGGAQEGAPLLWTLDIQVWDIEVLIPGVRAARQAGGAGVTPLHLEPVTGTPQQQRVYLVARGVVRVAGGGPGGTQVQIVDSPDPFDPTAPTGAVIRLTSRPPHFLFGQSQYGMTLDQFVIDLSQTFTPAEVVARGHDEAWQGVAFREATFYFPPDTPLVHSLSISARDVIIGSPGGLQGELRLEFGQDFADQYNTHIQVFQQAADGAETPVPETTPAPRGTSLQFAVSLEAGRPRRVRAQFGVSDVIPGQSNLGVVGVWWKLPTGQEGNTASTPTFDAPSDGLLTYRLRVGDPAATYPAINRPSDIPAGQTELGEVRVAFPRTGPGASGNGPLIDAVIGGDTLPNVVHLRGPRELLAGVTLQTRGGVNADWTLGAGSTPPGARAASSFTLPSLPEGNTGGDLVARTTDGTRRVRIDVVANTRLTVGHQETTDPASTSAVTVVGLGDATPTEVVDTFRAVPFHARADRPSTSAPATISGTHVTVPQGTIAEVVVPVPSSGNQPLPVPVPPNPPATSSAVQILYNFDESVPRRVVYPLTDEAVAAQDQTVASLHEPMARPMALALDGRQEPLGSSVNAQLQSWIASLPAAGDRHYYVVGRTDDIWYNGTQAENNTGNDQLAGQRRQAAVEALIAAGVPAASITRRVETGAFDAAVPPDAQAAMPARISNPGRLALPPGSIPPGQTRPVWNRSWTPDGTSSAAHRAAKDDSNRPPYRCTEIWTFTPAAPPPPPPPPPPPGNGVPVNVLVPGRDGEPPPPLPSTTTAPPPTDYRVRLRVRWDSPTVVTLADAIPTETEALVAWKPAAMELPASASAGSTPLPAPTGADFWELVLHWTYDARTAETEVSGALSFPDGVVKWASDALSGALAFGPAVAAMLDPADTVADPAGQFALMAAIIGAGAVIGELINTGSGPESTVEIDKVAISYRWNGSARVTATVDYTVDLRVNVSLAGSTLVGRLRLRYKGVGLRFDANDQGLQGVGLSYDGLSVEVVDPGTWSLGGPLGNLIRIAASRMGNGSQWMEFDLELALDLGVVRLEGATIRMTLQPFSVELRGLTARMKIENVLEGRGSVTVGQAGAFRALLALQIIPAKLGAYGSLAVDQDFVAVEVGVQFPVGIPLGATGLGLFGVMGRFVANGTRNLAGLSNPDPVQKQLDWYLRSPDQKYTRKSGQYALGLGAVIGTLPDGGFTFNAEGSLTLGFPDISVIFGIDAKLASERKLAATEGGTPSSSTLRILGLTIFEPEAIMIAVRASYMIPKVLRLEIPLSAYFPLQGSGLAWYLRIGTDNHPSRPGSPITIVLLPEILDVRAWAFVMIEERELHGLGGTLVPLDLADPLDFDGFSIGMGAGFDLKWSAGPFKLEISAFMLVGIGTKPLLFAGAAGIRGELDLVLISIGVDGLVHFHVSPGYSYLEGHFCGHVDCFFFEISGCVDIRIGDEPPSNIPEPGSPLLGMDLCDHLAAVKGRAARDVVADVPTVWPDTVAVLHFGHYVDDGLGGSSDFVRSVAPAAALSPWSGSTELKYAFRVKQVDLYELTGGDPASDASWTKVTGPFESAWWLPTHRRAAVVGEGETGPSTEEGRELGLFHWDPRAWSRWLGEGSQDLPGDPANTIDVVCDEVRPAEPSCAFGRDAQYAISALARFDARPRPGATFPSRFHVRARLGDKLEPIVLAALAGDEAWTWVPGAVAPLHGPVDLHGETLTDGWRLPVLIQADAFVSTLPVDFRFSKPLQTGELVLEVCVARKPIELPPGERCDTMPREQGFIGGFAGESGARYDGKELLCTFIDEEPAIVLTRSELRGEHPDDVTGVRIDLRPGKDEAVFVVAYDAAGAVVGRAESLGFDRQSLRVAGAGIRVVHLAARGSATVIFKVCWGEGEGGPLRHLIAGAPLTETPLVTVFDAEGNAELLVPQVLEQKLLRASAVLPPEACIKLIYRLPKKAGKGGWVHADVRPWRRGSLSLVAACGVTLEAKEAQAAELNFRGSLTGLLLQLIASFELGQPTHAVYLKPDAMYQVRVQWQWQGFRPGNAGDEPAPPSSSSWQDASKIDRFTFRTAAFGTAPAPLPAQTNSLETDPAQGGPGYDERVFDPRGLARYITRMTPGHEDAPHFLDDEIGVWFMVNHLEPLVEKYDRILQVKVLRTDPAPGELHAAPPHLPGMKHFLDVTIATAWQEDTLTWFAADHRFVEAAQAAPCIGGAPPMGSSSVRVTADLRPLAEYDLLLMVAPDTVGASAEVPVARSHFATSRYRNPTEFLRALGFTTPAAIRPPNDFITETPLGAGLPEVGDAELDLALTDLGMDPWPLPAGPRTTVVWAEPLSAGAPWRVAAVLLEADEPIWRPGFRTGAEGELEPPARLEVASLTVRRTFQFFLPPVILPGLGGGSGGSFQSIKTTAALGTLVERVRNAAGTRMLFVASSPIPVTGGLFYDIALSFQERGSAGATGTTSIFDRPLTVFQEGE
jgi:hypothetical protein